MIIPDRVVPTTCPYCGVGCNLELHIKDGYVYKVTSPFDAVVNRGNLCVKGRFGYDFIYNSARVTTPLIRKSTQAPGARTQAFERDQWREVSWDEALDYTAGRLVEIYQRDGADAMAVYCCAKATNEDNYLLQKLFRALFRTNNVDHCTRLCHAGSVVALQMAIGSSAMSNTAAEVIHSDDFSRHRFQHRRDPSDYCAANEGRGGQPWCEAHRRGSPAGRDGRLGRPLAAREAGDRRAALFRYGARYHQGAAL
jgi:predicted molibdopterin-dependent oxidoreductase YjgC